MNANRMTARARTVVGFAVVLLLGATVGAVVTNTILATGTLSFLDSIGGPASVRIQFLTLDPGDSVDWHYHTGDVWAVVKTGTLTEETPCGGEETLATGQAFHETEGRIHRVRNGGSETVQIYLAYITPEGQPRTVFVPAPLCIGPPASAEACKNGMWQTFTVPRLFKNQGDCVSFVESVAR